MTPLTTARLTQMIEAASKATPGPWEATYNDTIDIREQDGSRLAQCTMLYKGGSCRRPINDVEANAAHIAACDPQTIIALCKIALAAADVDDSYRRGDFHRRTNACREPLHRLSEAVRLAGLT